MGSFRIMTRAELRTRRKLPPEDVALFDQFKSYLTRLNGTDVGVYEYAKGEDHERCKKLLRKAAKAIDVRIRVVDDADSLMFYPRSVREKTSRSEAVGGSEGTPIRRIRL